MSRRLLPGILIVLVANLLACASPSAGGRETSDGTGTERPDGPPKRLVAAIRGVPSSMAQQETNRIATAVPGLDAITELIHASVVHADHQGTMHAQLGEAVPTLENGLWQ